MAKTEREKRDSRRQSASEWAKQQESSGSGGCIRVPDGYEQYKWDVGDHELDFIPSCAGSKREKMIGKLGADEGMEVWELTFAFHWIPDLTGKFQQVLCSAYVFGEPCAVCDKIKGGLQGHKMNIRHLFWVNDKPGDAKNKVKLAVTYHKNRGQGFAELLADAIQDSGEDNPFSLTEGYRAKIKVKEIPGSPESKPYKDAVRISLQKRAYNYPNSLLEKIPSLDGCLAESNYDEVLALLEGRSVRSKKKEEENGEQEEEPRKPARDEDEDDTPRGRSKPPVRDEDEDEDEEPKTTKVKAKAEELEEDEEDTPKPPKKKESKKEPNAEELGLEVNMMVTYKGDVCKILKISGDGTSLRLEDDITGDVHNGIAPGEVEKRKSSKPKDEDEEEEKPRGKSKAKARDEEEDEDDEEDEEDDD